MDYRIENINDLNRTQVNNILINEWESTNIIVRGTIVDATKLDGFVAVIDNEIVGSVTYMFEGNVCEIVSLNSLKENNGIATNLIEKVKEVAKSNKCDKLRLVTSNDNIRALEFYQRRGFVFSNIYIKAIENYRKNLKPQIPLYADNGLPIRDEIEFEMKL